MEISDFQAAIWRTVPAHLGPRDLILMASLGIGGEGGEIIEEIKHLFFHANGDTPKFRINLRKEIGDLSWYIALLCNLFSFDWRQILEENQIKLATRYPNGFVAIPERTHTEEKDES